MQGWTKQSPILQAWCFKHGKRVIQILARTARALLYSMQACCFICERSQGIKVKPGAESQPLSPIIARLLSRSWKLSCKISRVGKYPSVSLLVMYDPSPLIGARITEQALLLYDHSIPSSLKNIDEYRSGGVVVKTYVEEDGKRMDWVLLISTADLQVYHVRFCVWL